jgi:hypothetical protein
MNSRRKTTINDGPAAPGPERRSIARLNARQQYLLAGAIKEQADRLCREKPTPEAAAEEFSGKLGFRVGSSSVRTAMEATGVVWEYARRGRGLGLSRQARARLLHAVREAVIGLLEEQGLPVPGDLATEIVEAGQVFRHGEASGAAEEPGGCR